MISQLALRRSLFPIWAAMAFCIHTQGQDQLELLKQNTQQWIEASERLAKEKGAWASQRQSLRSSIVALEASVEAMQSEKRRRDTESADLDRKLSETGAALENHARIAERMEQALDEYEERIQGIASVAPEPLLEELAPLQRKIKGSEGGEATLSARLQNLVAMSSQIDEFNNQLTAANTIKTLENGESVSVRTLYWGLAIGYACTADGSQAWVLQPSENGWSWKPETDAAVAIKTMFDVYEKSADPVFAMVPVSLSQNVGESQ